MKSRTGELAKLSFSASHRHQLVGADPTPLQHCEAFSAIVLIDTPSAKTTKAFFEEYTGELSQDQLKELISKPKECNFTQLHVLSLTPIRDNSSNRTKLLFLI